MHSSAGLEEFSNGRQNCSTGCGAQGLNQAIEPAIAAKATTASEMYNQRGPNRAG